MKVSAVVIFALSAAVVALSAVVYSKPPAPFGSALEGQEYYSTTTAATISGTFDGLEVLKVGPGSLAQVTITGANTGVLVFYDATTTDVNLRTGNYASTSISIAEIPASATAGTYTFDARFTRGLIMSRLTGSGPTSTVTWR